MVVERKIRRTCFVFMLGGDCCCLSSVANLFWVTGVLSGGMGVRVGQWEEHE